MGFGSLQEDVKIASLIQNQNQITWKVGKQVESEQNFYCIDILSLMPLCSF